LPDNEIEKARVRLSFPSYPTQKSSYLVRCQQPGDSVEVYSCFFRPCDTSFHAGAPQSQRKLL
jgi:hypothetical protein